MEGSSETSISIASSRTISYEETTRRKFSFSVEDLAQSDAGAVDLKLRPLAMSNLVASEVPDQDGISRTNTNQPARPGSNGSKRRKDAEGKNN